MEKAVTVHFSSKQLVPFLQQNDNDRPISYMKPFKPSRCIKASFYIAENRLNFPTTGRFRMKISLKLVYQYMVIFFNFSPTLNRLYLVQVGNCNSNSRLVVDEDDNGKFKLERVNSCCVRMGFLLPQFRPTVTASKTAMQQI